MRLSPVLVAAVAWVTLSNPHSASGQTAAKNTNNAHLSPEELELTASSQPTETAVTLNSIPHTQGEVGEKGEYQQWAKISPHLPISPAAFESLAPHKPASEMTTAAKPDQLVQGLTHINSFSPVVQPPELLAHSATVASPELNSPQTTQIAIATFPKQSPELTAQTTPDPPPPAAETDTPTPSTTPTPSQPPPGTQTPQQETPDRLNITPGSPPSGTPAIEDNVPPPPATPPFLPTPPASESPPAGEGETRVLVAEVLVSGAEGRLEEIVYNAIRTRAGRTTTKSQLQEDINAVFATGYFSKVRAEPSDTPLGVRVTFIVEPNPVLRSVRVEGKQVLPDDIVDRTFREQYNEILNFRDLQAGIKQLEQWYKDRGYVLAQIVDTRVAPDGTVTLEVAEGVIEDVQVRFLNKEGETTDAQGQPIRGRTRQYVIVREMATKQGAVFNRNQVQRDLQRIYGLGLFDDVKLSLNPGENPRQVNVQVNVRERNTGSIAAGAGFSSAAGLFGTVSYQQQNFLGRNQKIGAEVQLGQRELLFDARFTDPWIKGDPYRTSYTVNVFRRRTISLIFDGGDPEIRLPNGDRPRILRLGGGTTFSRPLSKNPLENSEWVASLGFQYQRVSIRDVDGELTPRDELGNDLSFSGEGEDDLLTVQLGIVRDNRDNPLRATRGSVLRLGLEQSVPIGLGSIMLTRVRGSYSFYFPVKFTSFTPGPQALAFNVQAGTVLGDLPPYEAFSLGGANSVRGYDEGDLGSGRTYFQATAEYRFPIFSIIGGALFVDFGTDLGTASEVPGRPAEIRGKPGTGFGYGLGVRIQSPLGPIRIDYGFDEDGDGRIHFGIGERF